MAKFARGEAPPQRDYRSYRPFLRRDFLQRCAYCERPEAALGGEESFEIDHFRPQWRLGPDEETYYPNLYYACAKCNRHKGKTWPSDALLANGFRFADPCEEDMYIEHLCEQDSGQLQILNNCGRYTCEHIRLNRPDVVEWRSQRSKRLEERPSLEKLLRGIEELLVANPPTEVRRELEKSRLTVLSALDLLAKLYSL